MSMIAQFVQVSPSLLDQILQNPRLVAELLTPDGRAPLPPTELSDSMRQDWGRRLPGLLDHALAGLNPSSREAVAKHLGELGVDVESVKRGADSDALVNLIAGGFKSQVATASGGRPDGAGATLSLDKAWHGVHYLLCGKAKPGPDVYSQVVLGGREIGGDLGYGPARFLGVKLVRRIATELSQPHVEPEFTGWFDVARLTNAGIYPTAWRDEDAAWLLAELRRVRDFYVDASARGNAVVTWLE